LSGRGGGAIGLARPIAGGAIALFTVLMIALVASPMLLFAGAGVLYSSGGGCVPGQAAAGPAQPAVSVAARNSIPADLLMATT